MHSNSEEGPITDINVTPLVDVSLVLVIIFMAVAPFVLQAGIKAVDSKTGAAEGKAAMDKNVSVILEASGAIIINDRKVSLEQYPDALKRALATSQDRLVSVAADPSLSVGAVVEVLDISKQNGARKLAILRNGEGSDL
ncbi:MAG: biopolymer transporter ExbD [Elusimicrobia bacterium]|nr:biopolymer transporter ExbD [Elusimicrobiota bacterium]